MTRRHALLATTIAALAASSVAPARGDDVPPRPPRSPGPSSPEPILIDTDFAMPPVDDALAVMLALRSPEVDVVGITTVAGNVNVDQSTADVLRFLEIVGRVDVPVYRGAARPLVHAPDDFARRRWGTWWSDAPARPPPGGFASRGPHPEPAERAIARIAAAAPGRVTLVALGPLTNVARALALSPTLARDLKRIVIMGGAIAALPDGAGNLTPNAEFNFWVDPEAARIVLRSGIPVTLSPLNVSRQTAFTKAWYDRIVAVDTPFTRLLRETLGPRLERDPQRTWLMYDQVAVASVVDPTLLQDVALVVDVDDHPGIDYGVSVGWREAWPGAEGAPVVAVQRKLDWDRFIRLFAERVTR